MKSKQIFSPFKKPPALSIPWPNRQEMHVRDIPTLLERSIELNSDHKDKQSRLPDISYSDSIITRTLTAHSKLPPSKLHTPIQAHIHRDDLVTMANSTITNPAHKQILSSLLKAVGEFSAFDNHECEHLSWTQKYTPKHSSEVITGGSSAIDLASNLSNRIHQLNSSVPRPIIKRKTNKRKLLSELDDFIVDEDSEETEVEDWQNGDTAVGSPLLILHGPSGSGKTSAVYAAGHELNAYVFELNSGQRRASKDILDILGGIGRSQLVHSKQVQNQNTIVLLDDVDVLFEDDKSFWTGVEKFIETSRRPVVMTCTDKAFLPKEILQMADDHNDAFQEFTSAPVQLQADALWLIALCEGHLIARTDLIDLIQRRNSDFRAALTELQFWCQMGVGGKPSGIDWMITWDARQHDDRTQGIRVISKETFIGARQAKDSKSYGTIVTPFKLQQIDLATWILVTESLSAQDIIRNSTANSSLFTAPSTFEKDQLIGIESSSEPSNRLPLLEFELDVASDLLSLIESFASKSPFCIDTVNDLPKIECMTTRDQMLSVGLNKQLKGATLPVYSTIETAPMSILTTEIMPTLRTIALDDLEKTKHYNEIMDQMNNVDSGPSRKTRAAYSAIGIDTSKFERYLTGNLQEILSTGDSTWRDTVRMDDKVNEDRIQQTMNHEP